MGYSVGYTYPIEATIQGEDLTGATAVIVFRKPNQTERTTAAAVVDAANSKITYQLGAVDNTTPGVFRFKFDITKDGNTTPTEWADIYITEQ